jgi:hypothetical protein
MENKKVLDFRVGDDLLKSFDMVVKGYSSKNVTRSKLLDIALTILFSDEDSREHYLKRAEKDICCNGKPKRQTFLIKNQIVIDTLEQCNMFKKKNLIEYAMYYIVNRMQIADDFKYLMIDYINAGGVLL